MITKMKKISFSVFALAMAVLFAPLANAQNQEGKEGKKMSKEEFVQMEAKRIASDLALDDATTEKFVKTFTAYQNEAQALGKEEHLSKDKMADMTDAQVDEAIKGQFKQSRALLDLREKYYKKYREFLSPKQVQRVYAAEKRFHERLKKHHEKGGPRGEGRGDFKGQKGHGPQKMKDRPEPQQAIE